MMPKDYFDLLQKKHLAPENPQLARIQELRGQARYYRDENNKWVGRVWDIDLKLVQPNNEGDRESLIKEKKKLLQKIEREGYLKKIDELLEEIKALEIDLYGHSDVGGSSPYQL